MGNAAQRAETPHARRKVVDGRLVGDVERDGLAVEPRFASDAACSVTAGSFTSATINTSTPPTSRCAHAAPIPLPAPVTSATEVIVRVSHERLAAAATGLPDLVILRTGTTAGVRCARGTRSSVRGLARVRVPRRTTAGAAGAVDAVPLPMKGPPGANSA